MSKEKQDAESETMFHCKCGKSMPNNAGGISTHLNGDQHKEDLAKLLQQHKITAFFQPKNASNTVSNESVPSNQHNQNRNSTFNDQNYIRQNDDESKEPDHTHLTHDIVTVDKDNMIVNVENVGKVKVTFCKGVIPNI